MIHKKSHKKLTAMELRSLKNAYKDRFLGYVHRRRDIFIRVMHAAHQNTTSSTGDWDRRWKIGDLMVEAITRRFPSLIKINNAHYDMISRVNGDKISIKSGGKFVRPQKNINKSPYVNKAIQVKNRHGIIKKEDKAPDVIKNDGWNKMLVIQKQDRSKDIYCTFGIVSFKKVQKECCRGKNEQILVLLKNSDYDYFYKSPIFLPEYSEEELEDRDAIYLAKEKETNSEMLLNGRINIWE